MLLASYSAGIDFACSKEDAVGAIRAERWWEVDNSLKRMLRDLAVIEMAHHGVNIHILNWNFPKIAKLRELVDGGLWGNDKGYKRATNAFFAELQARADKNWSRTDDPLQELMD